VTIKGRDDQDSDDIDASLPSFATSATTIELYDATQLEMQNRKCIAVLPRQIHIAMQHDGI